MALKKTLILGCVAIVAVGIVVLVALGACTVVEGLGLSAMASVFLGVCAMLDADDWSSGRGGGGGAGESWFGGDGDGAG